MSSRDPVERRRLATIAANTRWAGCEDRTAATQAARDAQQRKREETVDPEHTLSPKERAKRAENLRLAEMQRIALKGSRAPRHASAQSKRRGAATGTPQTSPPARPRAIPKFSALAGIQTRAVAHEPPNGEARPRPGTAGLRAGSGNTHRTAWHRRPAI
jgi:hypothetical protein